MTSATLIIGAGATGRHIAATLLARGALVVLIDRHAQAVAQIAHTPSLHKYLTTPAESPQGKPPFLPPPLAPFQRYLNGTPAPEPRLRVYQADGATPAGLLAGNVLQAAQLVAATGDDAVNLLVATLAHQVFGVPRIIARLHDRDHAWLYTPTFGVTYAFSEADLLAAFATDALAPPVLQAAMRLHYSGMDLREWPVPADSPTLGHPLSALKFPPDVTVVAIFRAGRAHPAQATTVLEAGDILWLAARPAHDAALAAALAPARPAPLEVLSDAPPAIEIIKSTPAPAEPLSDAPPAVDVTRRTTAPIEVTRDTPVEPTRDAPAPPQNEAPS